MTRLRARLTGGGQITAGDELEFVARGGEVLVEVRSRRNVLDFAGLASNAATEIPATAEEIDALIERGMTEAAIARSTRRH